LDYGYVVTSSIDHIYFVCLRVYRHGGWSQCVGIRKRRDDFSCAIDDRDIVASTVRNVDLVSRGIHCHHPCTERVQEVCAFGSLMVATEFVAPSITVTPPFPVLATSSTFAT